MGDVNSNAASSIRMKCGGFILQVHLVPGFPSCAWGGCLGTRRSDQAGQSTPEKPQRRHTDPRDPAELGWGWQRERARADGGGGGRRCPGSCRLKLPQCLRAAQRFKSQWKIPALCLPVIQPGWGHQLIKLLVARRSREWRGSVSPSDAHAEWLKGSRQQRDGQAAWDREPSTC